MRSLLTAWVSILFDSDDNDNEKIMFVALKDGTRAFLSFRLELFFVKPTNDLGGRAPHTKFLIANCAFKICCNLLSVPVYGDTTK